MISFDDFTQRKAVTLAGLNYCARCNPLAGEQTSTPVPSTAQPAVARGDPPRRDVGTQTPLRRELIHFKCPQCSKRLQTKPDLAGKNIKCPGCNQVIKIPSPAVPKPQPPKPIVSRTEGAPAKLRTKLAARKGIKKSTLKWRGK